jgi:hypothetical protein
MIQKRQRTDKSKYKHQTTGDYCTCSQYIAELMCLKNAQFKNTGSLPYKFWNVKPWSWTFLKQKMMADKLINEYGESVVIKAITSDDFKSIFSLSNKKCTLIFKKYQEIEKSKQQQEIKPIQVNESATVRKKTFGNKNTLSKLRGLDGGKKEE